MLPSRGPPINFKHERFQGISEQRRPGGLRVKGERGMRDAKMFMGYPLNIRGISGLCKP
jgi:hypothetical protein